MMSESEAQGAAFTLPARALLLAGPTAVGKSEVALLLAERLGGEIISVDSMQVYRGMDIGTAKASIEERRRVPHHLVDVVDLAEPFDAAQFVQLTQAALKQIQERQRLPILCGGTGLYFKALLGGLGESPPSDPALRAELQSVPLEELLRELAARDPVTFERIDRQNPRRVIRAVEVVRLTGKPFSAQRADWAGQARALVAPPFFALAPAPSDLRRRIDERVERMFQRGLLAETQALLNRGLARNQTALQALGYRQVAEYLQGVRSLPQTIELVKIRTHQFAKRQMTWFRRQLPVRWIHLSATESSADIATRLLSETKLDSQ